MNLERSLDCAENCDSLWNIMMDTPAKGNLVNTQQTISVYVQPTGFRLKFLLCCVLSSDKIRLKRTTNRMTHFLSLRKNRWPRLNEAISSIQLSFLG